MKNQNKLSYKEQQERAKQYKEQQRKANSIFNKENFKEVNSITVFIVFSVLFLVLNMWGSSYTISPTAEQIKAEQTRKDNEAKINYAKYKQQKRIDAARKEVEKDILKAAILNDMINNQLNK